MIGFDLYPTFTEVAGIAAANPDNLDGNSFKAHLVDQAPVADRDIFFGYEPKLGTAMRRGPWKLIVKGDEIELYHLDNDPGETTNIVKDHPDVVAAMRAEIETFKATVVPGS
ncbi:MAG: hypothetical protein ACNA8L_06510 [Luteolibacter sp.]